MSITLDSARSLRLQPLEATLSPALAGRPAGDRLLLLLEGAALPGQSVGTVLSLSRSGWHLLRRSELPRR